jgi:hypothetical protein
LPKCHLGAIERRWTSERVLAAMLGVDAGVDQLDQLSDPLGSAGARERVNTATIQLAEGVP